MTKYVPAFALMTAVALMPIAVQPLAAAPSREASPEAIQAALAAPCSLITLSEVQGLIGNLPMQPATPIPSADPNRAGCNYVPDTRLGVSADNHNISVTIFSSPVAILKSSLLWPDQTPGSDHALTDNGVQAVPSLGPDAYCNARPDALGDQAGLLVAIDATHTLDVIEEGGVMTCDLAAQFAKIALARLNSGSLAAPSTALPPVSADLLTNAMAYPCSIVTADEAAAIFGGTMETSLPPIGQPKNPFCTWHNGSVSIIGQIYSDPEESGENDIGAFQTLTGPGGVEADCSNPGPGQFILITAIDANHYLSVVGAVPGPATCDQAFQFALKALPRL